jgi:hypothetical protein
MTSAQFMEFFVLQNFGLPPLRLFPGIFAVSGSQ